jgi:hypothetical protein
MSLPIKLTRVKASGPLPTKVAPFDGVLDLAVSPPNRLAMAENTNLPASDVDLAATKVDGVQTLFEAGHNFFGVFAPPSM